MEAEINERAAAELAASMQLGISKEVADRIQSILPLINEANVISEELSKGVIFELKLFAHVGSKGKKKSKGAPVNIQIQLSFSDTTHEDVLWDPETFTDWLYEMRDMINSFLEHGGDMAFLQRQYSGENDPFFIEGNEQLIGRSLIYLDPINHLLPIKSKTPIIDYNGFSRGMLELTLTPRLPKVSEAEMQDKFDELETCDNLVGKGLNLILHMKGLKGIPAILSKEVNVKFRFFMDQNYTSTDKSEGLSINPKYGSSVSKTTEDGNKKSIQELLQDEELSKENAIAAQALAELGSKEEELEELRFQLQETKMDMQQKLRAQEDKLKSVPNQEELFKAKLEAKDELAARVKFAETKLEKAEKERDELTQKLNECRDELRQAELELQTQRMKIESQENEIVETKEQLEAAGKKSKACVLL